MSDQQQAPVSLQQPIEDHPALGRYISHHPSRRGVLILRGGLVYTAIVMPLNLIFINDDSIVVAILLPSVFIICALVILWYIAHLWNREVILYERGFTYREGSQLGTFFYQEITTLKANVQRASYFGVFRRTAYNYILKTQQEEMLTITNLYDEIERLTERLESYIIRDRLPLIRGQMLNGETVPFGEALRASKMGLEYEGRELFWHEIAGYSVRGGYLYIQSQDDDAWATIQLNEINNILLLVALFKVQRTQASRLAN